MHLYHVLGEKYQEGDPIYSMQAALEKGVVTEDDYRWDEGQPFEEYHDYFNICFFDNLDDAIQWAEENEQSRIAKIDPEYLPDPDINEEGHLILELAQIEPEDIMEVIKVG